MKKFYFLLLFLLISISILRSQSIIYETNFDTLTVGDSAVYYLGDPWNTFSEAPGDPMEDAVISDIKSHSGSNALYIDANNDVILNLNDKTTGRYNIQFYLHVDTNYLAYFNFLNHFLGPNLSVWGFEAYIYDDSVFVYANGPMAAKAHFLHNTWNKVNMIVELDSYFATFLINGAEIYSYQLSKGALGMDTLCKLDAINFYGMNPLSAPTPTNATIGYYIDDIRFEMMAIPEAPSNLTAEYTASTEDIDITWTAPSVVPDSYALYRNNTKIYSGTNMSFSDNQPQPNDYGYGVRAFYQNLGYSHLSNIDSATVQGGIMRNLVLLENITNVNSLFCPLAMKGVSKLIQVNKKDAVAIDYHITDDYTNVSSIQRKNYYGVTDVPVVVFDGTTSKIGISHSVEMSAVYLPVYNECIANKSYHSVSVNVVPAKSYYCNLYEANITVQELFKSHESGWKLHTAVVESNIDTAWNENFTDLDYVCRGMYPDAAGSDLNFSRNNTQSVKVTFVVLDTIKNNCQFIVFVQHAGSKEITQTIKVDMASIAGIKELKGEKISIYPNPASDYVMLLSNGNGNLDILDITGKMVYSSKIYKNTQYIDVSSFKKGYYIAKVSNNDNTYTQKLIIK